MRLPKKPLNANLKFPDPPGTLRWLGAVGAHRLGVGDACSDAQTAANAAAQSVKNLKAQMVDLDAAIMGASINNQDTTDLENQKKQLQAAINTALGNASAAVGKAAILCAAKATAETCPTGYTKDASGKCVPGPAPAGCQSDAECGPNQICLGYTCVDCPAGQVRNAQGNCAPPPTASTGGGGWAILGLAAAAVGGIFIASRGQLKELGAGRGNQYRTNPGGSGGYVRGGGYVVRVWEPQLGAWVTGAAAATKEIAEEKRAQFFAGQKTRIEKRGGRRRRR